MSGGFAAKPEASGNDGRRRHQQREKDEADGVVFLRGCLPTFVTWRGGTDNERAIFMPPRGSV